MKHRLKEPFGKAGLTVAVIALVMALVGGAYAAGGLTKAQEKQVTKIAKKYAGKPGAPGATGPAGPAGTNGTNGKDGTNGAPGAPGTSVTNTTVPVGDAKCAAKLGGAEFKVGAGAATFACNGQTGFTKTLPSKETEQGVWTLTAPPKNPTFGIVVARTAISFVIPLAAEPEETHVLIPGEEETAECPGTPAEPKAEPGQLCIYVEFAQDIPPAEIGATPHAFGALLNNVTGEPGGIAQGTWAVTAE